MNLNPQTLTARVILQRPRSKRLSENTNAEQIWQTKILARNIESMIYFSCMNCINFPKKLHCDRGEVGSPSCQWTARTVRVPSTPHHFYCVITCVAPEFFVRALWLVWCARGISSATTYTLQREVLALAANLISLQEWATQCKDWQIRVFFLWPSTWNFLFLGGLYFEKVLFF